MEEKNFMKDLCGVYGITVLELTEEELEQYPEKPVRAFLVMDAFGSHEAGSKAVPSRYSYDRHEAMRRFFQKIPAHYMLDPGEQVELMYWPLGEDELFYREYFLDLEQASARAVSLGPSYEISIQAVAEPGTTPWDTDGCQTLARWIVNFGPLANGEVVVLEPLRQAEPSFVCREYFSDWPLTWEASRFYYRSRCPIRAQIEERRRRRQDEGD